MSSATHVTAYHRQLLTHTMCMLWFVVHVQVRDKTLALEKQEAANRAELQAEHDAAVSQLQEAASTIQQLQQQLAAGKADADGRVATAASAVDEASSVVEEMRQQLVAAQGRVQDLEAQVAIASAMPSTVSVSGARLHHHQCC
jgi:chromosome segregation ATPase